MLRQERETREQTGSHAKLAASGGVDHANHQQSEGRPASTPPVHKAAAAPADSVQHSERAEIARRVAAFRERQLMLQRQREDYYEAMMAKTRAELRSDPRPPRR
jgi:hypothetical protein